MTVSTNPVFRLTLPGPGAEDTDPESDLTRSQKMACPLNCQIYVLPLDTRDRVRYFLGMLRVPNRRDVSMDRSQKLSPKSL